MQKRKYSLPMILLGLLMIIIVACTNTANLTEVEANENTTTDIPPTAALNPTATLADPTATAVQVDNCTSCHTDKDRLTDTADTEEEVISENEGEG